MKDRYRPCRSCGATRVKRQVVETAYLGREAVVVVCDGCDNVRSTYTRRTKAKKETN